MKQAVLIDDVGHFNEFVNGTAVCLSAKIGRNGSPWVWMQGRLKGKIHAGDLVVVQPTETTIGHNQVWEIIDEEESNS